MEHHLVAELGTLERDRPTRYILDLSLPKRPDGKFRIEIFSAGDLVDAGQVLDAVQQRVVECGHTASTRFFDTDPA